MPESASLFYPFHVRPESVAATSSTGFTCRPVYCSAVFVSSSLATTVSSEVATVVTTCAHIFAVLLYRSTKCSEEPSPLAPVPSFLLRSSRVTPLPPPAWAPPSVFISSAPSLCTAYPATCGSFTAGAAATRRLPPLTPPFPPPPNAAAHTAAQLPSPRPAASPTGTHEHAAPAAAERRRAGGDRSRPRLRPAPRQ